jgi:hypothetical protein
MKIFQSQILKLEMFFGHVTLQNKKERERDFFTLKIKLGKTSINLHPTQSMAVM